VYLAHGKVDFFGEEAMARTGGAGARHARYCHKLCSLLTYNSCLIALKASGIIEQVTAMSSLGAASILTAGTAAQEARRNWVERLYPKQG